MSFVSEFRNACQIQSGQVKNGYRAPIWIFWYEITEQEKTHNANRIYFITQKYLLDISRTKKDIFAI